MKDATRGVLKKIGNGGQLVGVGAVTGVFVGLVVTLYNAVARMAEEFSHGYYGFFRENPAFIPLLFLALFLGAILIGGLTRFLPAIRGSGIPQTEGATRGLLRLKWYEALTGMFAASLFSIFMGLSAGSEGPSIMIGGACGGASGDLFRSNATVRRYQITGGACAGLAVAFNAPLTGMAFAFEEAHKRFTPEVFVCSFSSVVVAVIVRNLLGPLLGMGYGAAFTSYSFAGIETFDLPFLGYVLLSSLVVALVGVAFYFLVVRAGKIFKKITFLKGAGKMIVPFLLAGAFGLITSYAMGGGSEFIGALGSLGTLERIFSSPLWVTLLVVVVIKLFVTVVNMGAGVPCGAFIPMLAIGAGLGGLLSLLCAQMGMDGAYSDALIMICMAAFFTTVVKAPITGIIMTVELTWNFTFLLPVILGVAVGYLVGSLFRTKPIYDKFLDDILEEQRKKIKSEKISVRLRVAAGSIAAGRNVRDVLWPAKTRIVLLERGDLRLTPDGNTVLLEGDLLTVEGETAEKDEFVSLLVSTVGELIQSEEPPAEAQKDEES